MWTNDGCSKAWESQCEKLRGLVIERNSNFNDYILSICKTRERKKGREKSELFDLVKLVPFAKVFSFDTDLKNTVEICQLFLLY